MPQMLILPAMQCFQYAAALVRATCGNHPVAEVFFVLWALGHLIEGASGFGTGPAMLPRETVERPAASWPRCALAPQPAC